MLMPKLETRDFFVLFRRKFSKPNRLAEMLCFFHINNDYT